MKDMNFLPDGKLSRAQFSQWMVQSDSSLDMCYRYGKDWALSTLVVMLSLLLFLFGDFQKKVHG